jgi:hypothetical protein
VVDRCPDENGPVIQQGLPEEVAFLYTRGFRRTQGDECGKGTPGCNSSEAEALLPQGLNLRASPKSTREYRHG